MSVRPFDWRDLIALYRYRNEGIYLDSALVLTRGALVVPGVIFSYLAPSMGVFTCISNGNHRNRTYLMGQFIHTAGSLVSHLTFLSPVKALEIELVGPLVEYMMSLSGARGALRLLADVDEQSKAFEALRRCGFVIYNRQRIWRLQEPKNEPVSKQGWRAATEQDVTPVRNLYNNLIPGMVQQIEPFSSQRPHGLVYYHSGDLMAYVELKYGHRGIWAQPFFHPDAQDLPVHLNALINKILGRRVRPIFFCVRSYQSWLEPFIEDLGAEAGPRQAVLARQLVIQQKAVRPFALPALEGGQPEISAPIARAENSLSYVPEKNNR